MKKAWLITWDGPDVREGEEDNVILILNYRLSPNRVREFVERFYAVKSYSITEKLACAKSQKNNPYPAQFERINGVQFIGRIICGHNPFLYGRLVKNLHVEKDDSGNEQLKWDEIPLPKFPKL